MTIWPFEDPANPLPVQEVCIDCPTHDWAREAAIFLNCWDFDNDCFLSEGMNAAGDKWMLTVGHEFEDFEGASMFVVELHYRWLPVDGVSLPPTLPADWPLKYERPDDDSYRAAP